MKKFFTYATVIALVSISLNAFAENASSANPEATTAKEESTEKSSELQAQEAFEREQRKSWKEFKDKQRQEKEAFKAEMREKRDQWHKGHPHKGPNTPTPTPEGQVQAE